MKMRCRRRQKELPYIGPHRELLETLLEVWFNS